MSDIKRVRDAMLDAAEQARTRAYSDGVLAERERILALLRELD